MSWTEHRTNEWVREHVQVDVKGENKLLQEVKRRKIRKIRVWKRRAESMMLTTVEGETNGRGRSRVERVHNIIHWEGSVEQAYVTVHKRMSTAHTGQRLHDTTRFQQSTTGRVILGMLYNVTCSHHYAYFVLEHTFT